MPGGAWPARGSREPRAVAPRAGRPAALAPWAAALARTAAVRSRHVHSCHQRTSPPASWPNSFLHSYAVRFRLAVEKPLGSLSLGKRQAGRRGQSACVLSPSPLLSRGVPPWPPLSRAAWPPCRGAGFCASASRAGSGNKGTPARGPGPGWGRRGALLLSPRCLRGPDRPLVNQRSGKWGCQECLISFQALKQRAYFFCSLAPH